MDIQEALQNSLTHNARYSISISSLKTFTSCRRKFKWSSSLYDNLEPNEPSLPFFIGSVIHSALEIFYGYNVSLKTATKQACKIEILRARAKGANWGIFEQILHEQEQLSHKVLQHYDLWINGKAHSFHPLEDGKLTFLAVETAFNVPIYTPNGKKSSYISLVGRFDGIVLLNDGTYWLWENKTSSRIHDLINSLDNDLQATGYIYAIQELTGLKISGVIYNILLKKEPATPRILKSGMLSTNKNISSTFEAYLQDVKAHHPTYSNSDILKEYSNILTELNHDNKFFKRITIHRTQEQIEAFKKYIYDVGLEMVRPSTIMYPSFEYNACKWCKYKDACLAKEQNFDYQLVLDNNFKKRSKLLVGFNADEFRFEPITQDEFLLFYREDTIVSEPSPLYFCIKELLHHAYNYLAVDIEYVIDILTTIKKSYFCTDEDLKYISFLEKNI